MVHSQIIFCLLKDGCSIFMLVSLSVGVGVLELSNFLFSAAWWD